MRIEAETSWRSALFAGKHVLVTGATSGIGLAIARLFKTLGAEVTGTATSNEKADFLSSQGIVPVIVDIRSDETVRSSISSLASMDVLVNNAGIVRRVEEHEFDVFKDVIEVNLNGTARYCFWAKPLLAESKGCIVNIASMLSTFGDPLVPAYAASKGAVSQLTKSLAISYAPLGIRVNAIAPGWIATPLTKPLVDDESRSSTIVGRTPMGRWGEPDEVAQGAIFLASPAAKFVTGSTLTIDGGYSVR